MADYKIFIKPSAAKELEAVGRKEDRQRLVERIRSLAGEPRPRGCEKLSGQYRLYRVRTGSYRVLYEIDEDAAEVRVVKVGHRRDVYR